MIPTLFFAIAFVTASYAAGPHPVGTVVADLDGDGAPEIAVCNARSNSVTILWNDGRGAFAARPPVTLAAMPSPHLLAAADFNGDGRRELVVTGHDSNQAIVLWNSVRGFTGRTTSLQLFDGVRPHNHGLATDDIDGNGTPDITAGHQDENAIAVVTSDGRSRFRRRPRVATGRSPYPHAVADMDGDRRADIVVPNVGGDTVTIHYGGAEGSFRPVAIPVLARPYFVAVADLDADGRSDIVVAHDDTSTLTLLVAGERGRFEATRFDGGARNGKIAIADLDGDRRPEIASANGRETRVFARGEDGTYRLARTIDGGYWDIVAADVNRDGRPDLIVPDAEANLVRVHLTSK